METIDLLFVLILKFSVLAFLLLAAGALAIRFFSQPVERIRLIQISLATVFAAAILSYSTSRTSWTPKFDLPWLPQQQTISSAVTVKNATNKRPIHEDSTNVATKAAIDDTNKTTPTNNSVPVLTSTFPAEAATNSPTNSTGTANSKTVQPPTLPADAGLSNWSIAKTVFVFAFAICFMISISGA